MCGIKLRPYTLKNPRRPPFGHMMPEAGGAGQVIYPRRQLGAGQLVEFEAEAARGEVNGRERAGAIEEGFGIDLPGFPKRKLTDFIAGCG